MVESLNAEGSPEEATDFSAEETEWAQFGACILCLAEQPHELTDLCSSQTDSAKILQIASGSKEIGDYKDPISTGRKRAAVILPDESMGTCEWAYLKYAGGGYYPVVGCTGKPATDRHHGPDKSTFNNTRPGEGHTNLHAICSFCHNAWHAANDPSYGPNGKDDRPADNSAWVPIGESEYAQHDPNTQASLAEIMAAEAKRLLARGIK